MVLLKNDFVNKLAEKGYSKKDAAVIVDDFIDTLTEILANQDCVSFRGFGSFETRSHAPHLCTDFRTGERKQTDSRTVVKFVPGKSLKIAVKDGFYQK